MNKLIPSVIQDNGEYYIHMEEYKKIKELGEHYKHLYSSVKKQKDDVVEYLDKIEKMTDYEFRNEYWMQNILRMLGEENV